MKKKILEKNRGITLIALVITIIVMLILAAISITMLTGDNSILQKAIEAKTRTERATIIENAQTDILGQQSENKGADITKEQLTTILNKYFKTVVSNTIPDNVSTTNDLKLTTIDEKYTVNLSEIFKGIFSEENNATTLGENYQDSWIGKTIDYKSINNNVNDWIILGKQVNEQGKKDVIITTKNPVSSQFIDQTLAEWIRYETKINTACSNYIGTTGTLGTKTATIKEVRSITLEDINNAMGFTPPEQLKEYTFRAGENDFENQQVNYYFPNENEDNPAWVEPSPTNTWSHTHNRYEYRYGEYYDSNSDTWVDSWVFSSDGNNTILQLNSNNLKTPNNIKYILANEDRCWVATKEVEIYDGGAQYTVATLDSQIYFAYPFCGSGSNLEDCFDMNDGGNTRSIRPVVVLSSEIPWDDVKDLIGNYAQYD